MAAKIKFENANRLLEAQNNVIDDLLRENYELKKQMHQILTAKNETKSINRRSVDFQK